MSKLGFHKTMMGWLAAASLLTAMFLLMLGSSWEDSLTYDENVHVTAGYAYLRFQDARLNPEHPPLLKLLAAVPLLSLQLNFPLTHQAWQEDVLGAQWKFADAFLYESGNDPHRIAARARIAPIFLTILLGFVLFYWTRRFAGELPALLTLFLYVFSPTFLAHGRYITTDAPAALGVALAGFTFIRFLETPSRQTGLVSGLALGIALLSKFSTVLLIPFFASLTLLWMVLAPQRLWRYLSGLVIIDFSAALLVLLPYLWITAQYPPERQLQDTYFSFFNDRENFALLVHDRTRDLRACAHHLRPLKYCLADVAIFLADKPILRALDEYLLGLGGVAIHERYGHVVPTYFLGEISFSARRWFFPVVYFIKETLPFHILTVLALLLAIAKVWASSRGIRSIICWVRSHPAETFMLGWLTLYWSVTLNANLNLGVRHLLPVFPFTIILVSREISQWLRPIPGTVARSLLTQRMKQLAVIFLLIWQLGSVLRIYPSFFAYFNEAVGGPEGGADYVVDSDLDWGQDLMRLRTFVEVHRIDKIALAYHGTSSARYELGDKFIPWWSAQGPYKGWVAVSATILKKAQGRWDSTIENKPKPEDSYAWLQGKKPVTKIGYSILVFDLRDIG